MYTHRCICTYLYTHTHTHTHTHIYMYIYAHTRTHTYSCVCMYIYSYVHIFVYIYLYVYLCVYTYVYIYIPARAPPSHICFDKEHSLSLIDGFVDFPAPPALSFGAFRYIVPVGHRRNDICEKDSVCRSWEIRDSRCM